jgi:cell wall-associated NlpC family hydrolase
LSDGLVSAPLDAPAAVADAIAAANRIAKLPYRYGGGHRSFDDTAYDCSGSVSYALHGGGLLDATMTSGELASYGEAGPGRWITIYANADHVYAVIAGVRFDTSGQTRAGSRWQATMRRTDGFVVRHPVGL